MNRSGNDGTGEDTQDRQDSGLEAALSKALGADADDTAPLSRAVLSRMVATEKGRWPDLAEVLTAPLPAAGLMLGALLIAGALGYALVPGEVQDLMALQVFIGQGF
jgi:hypothetical protein